MTHRLAATLSVGDELTLGQRRDTNSGWLAGKLAEHSVLVAEHRTVSDDLRALTDAITELAARADVLIITGGLGPTLDDLTRQACAAAAGQELIEDPDSLAQIRAYFTARNRVMPEPNYVQALRPAAWRAIPNAVGTAPGLAGKIRDCDVFCLPGPPAEMMPMFEAAVGPALRPADDRTVAIRSLHTIGLGESEIASRFAAAASGNLMDRGRNPLVGTTASDGVVSCRLRYEGPGAHAQAALDQTEAEIMRLIGPSIFARGETGLARAVLEKLISNKQTLACVESCTGGLLAGAITDVPGSSAAFLGGWVTYSNDRKAADVGVPPDALSRHGAVSREVALLMARGGLSRAKSSWCLAVTGVAGPGGGSPQKPVGTVHIALAGRSAEDARLVRVPGDRPAVRRGAVTAALALLWLHLAGRPEGTIPREIRPPA